MPPASVSAQASTSQWCGPRTVLRVGRSGSSKSSVFARELGAIGATPVRCRILVGRPAMRWFEDDAPGQLGDALQSAPPANDRGRSGGRQSCRFGSRWLDQVVVLGYQRRCSMMFDHYQATRRLAVGDVAELCHLAVLNAVALSASVLSVRRDAHPR
jgi:hypothetical protein